VRASPPGGAGGICPDPADQAYDPSMAADDRAMGPDELHVPGHRVALLECDPELARHVTAEETLRARRAVTAPLIALPEGRFDPQQAISCGTSPFAALVVSGLIAREVTVGGQPTLRLLGPGDIVHGTPMEAGLLRPEECFTATLPTRLAILDDRFLHAVRHWPRLLTALVERAGEQLDATLVQLAISQQPRVEDRLVALFRALAERWGHVSAEGVLVPLSLTHEALGRLIGARRPTITLALKALARDRRLTRRSDGAWLVTDLDERGTHDVLQPLAGAARPRLLALRDGDGEGTGRVDAELIAQVRGLRLNHQILQDRMRLLAAHNEETVARTREVVARSREQREQISA
jgi:CRP/FNR family transcriptional regulator, cyclic AMP receptor protein